MLNIPEGFRRDIQGRDTALVPIITIGNNSPVIDNHNDWIYLSTNNISLRFYNDDRNFKPLLLNIPSIKESMDIESRKFNIQC